MTSSSRPTSGVRGRGTATGRFGWPVATMAASGGGVRTGRAPIMVIKVAAVNGAPEGLCGADGHHQERQRIRAGVVKDGRITFVENGGGSRSNR